MKLCMAQINTMVGDYRGNTEQVLATCAEAVAIDPEAIVVFPELTLCGYPPEDLLLRPSVEDHVNECLERLCRELPASLWVILGFPRHREGRLFNTAAVINRGAIIAEYDKQRLPNYAVFDEVRYFSAGNDPCVVEVAGMPVGLSICEDIWSPVPAASARQAGARLLVNLNSSPYHRGKRDQRWSLLADRARENHFPIVYVNQVGGQDELVFDGGSFAVDAAGEVVCAAPDFDAGLWWLELGYQDATVAITPDTVATPLQEIEAVWRALVLGLRDYVDKNGFPGVVLGLSGGIDSAVTLALAVDALGADRVHAVMMPFRYTASISIEDAEAEALTLGVDYRSISIEPIYEAFMASLSEEFAGLLPNITEENLQARCRGVLLMSISNKKNLLVLTTGNKSELAVGYSTLYGDMAGGFDVLKDCPKMLVYALARFRNSVGPVIPERVITRPPSAELAPDQKDEDSLPAYEVLDQIIELYVEQDLTAIEIISRGFEEPDVRRVIRLVDLNEYKRRQAPVGVRISQRAFGRDRRYPITWAWR
ncbi:NAD+ synthetase [Luminiphilus syltensis NOR5-1B]|uniref:Glutamine-dependent NAD(+) synthetase n=1 Tax=Luminiphilus syltensis NOR5-1B TaxID=565045 RepID=B8KX19_9GAMM|nr:NAD+ synthase [Luminiphilus syltensis]EED36961.1 NAD+ synthetase [Luminiphilus syltensis NOR5-1B]